MEKDKILLNDEKLKDVVGAGAPSEYLYKAELIVGTRVKSEPKINAEDVCVAPMYTLIYVLEEGFPCDFVYCVFKGDKHREYGYIMKSHFVVKN